MILTWWTPMVPSWQRNVRSESLAQEEKDLPNLATMERSVGTDLEREKITSNYFADCGDLGSWSYLFKWHVWVIVLEATGLPMFSIFSFLFVLFCFYLVLVFLPGASEMVRTLYTEDLRLNHETCNFPHKMARCTCSYALDYKWYSTSGR